MEENPRSVRHMSMTNLITYVNNNLLHLSSTSLNEKIQAIKAAFGEESATGRLANAAVREMEILRGNGSLTGRNAVLLIQGIYQNSLIVLYTPKMSPARISKCCIFKETHE